MLIRTRFWKIRHYNGIFNFKWTQFNQNGNHCFALDFYHSSTINVHNIKKSFTNGMLDFFNIVLCDYLIAVNGSGRYLIGPFCLWFLFQPNRLLLSDVIILFRICKLLEWRSWWRPFLLGVKSLKIATSFWQKFDLLPKIYNELNHDVRL